MKLSQRIKPCLYTLATSHKMIWELTLLPLERKVARRDAEFLQQQIPELCQFDQEAKKFQQRLQPFYDDYTSTVSPAIITISLELAACLTMLCQLFRPRTILDLGSGFSSFVFRHYVPDAGIKPTVYSVDESPEWLETTRRFLSKNNLSEENLALWKLFRQKRYRPFDFIFYDLGSLPVRKKLLPQVLPLCRPGGAIVLDDMHVPDYRSYVKRILNDSAIRSFSLRKFTKGRRRLRYALLVTP